MPKVQVERETARGASISVGALRDQGINRIMSARSSQVARISVETEFLLESAVAEWGRDVVVRRVLCAL